MIYVTTQLPYSNPQQLPIVTWNWAQKIHPPLTEEEPPQLHSPQEKILGFFLKLHHRASLF